jgi:flagellar assembly factor FliW
MSTSLAQERARAGGVAGGDAAEPKNVITFSKGLPGFEACRGFVLSTTPNSDLHCLSSLDGTDATFLAIDPRRALPGYRCQLSEADRFLLGASEQDDDRLVWLALLTVEPGGTISVNLRAPIVINPDRMLGQQVIPYQCIYPIRHVLAGVE